MKHMQWSLRNLSSERTSMNLSKNHLQPSCLASLFAGLLFCLVSMSGWAQISETVTYYHTDALGSIVAASDDKGEVIWRRTYTPYGERFADTSPEGAERQGFTGKPHDSDLGLSYFGARWYDPRLGRFMGMDPVGVEPGNIHSFNRYAYANNNPYRYVDLDGDFPVDTIWDIGNVIWDAGKIAVGYISDNKEMIKSGSTDIALDGAAMLIPYVPAGIAKLRYADDIAEEAGQVYHRLGDSAENIKKIKESGELRGNAPTNYLSSDIPKVKAYAGPLPEGKKGFEFSTDVIPDKGGHPFQPTWSGKRPGVRNENDQAIISCTVTKTNC